MVVESYSENNVSASMVPPKLKHYWLGLVSLDDLLTNTLESAAGMLVSQYAGSFPQYDRSRRELLFVMTAVSVITRATRAHFSSQQSSRAASLVPAD